MTTINLRLRLGGPLARVVVPNERLRRLAAFEADLNLPMTGC